LGKVKIAEILGRAGLHLAASTVGRIVKEPPADPAFQKTNSETSCPDKAEPQRIVTANRPNHVWHVDLTTVPISTGFWTPWIPNAFHQSWPFCWWVVVVLDHYSRRAMGFCLFRSRPTSAVVQAFLDRTIQQQDATPKYLISDKGVQFWCSGYKDWCQLRGILPRFGAVGQHGSIAVIERFIRTLKDEGSRRRLVSQRRQDFRGQMTWFFQWYNEMRPHMTLGGKTPNEVYHARPPANQEARIEPRPRWPVHAPCAKPRVPVEGKTGAVFQLELAYHAEQKHLPIVTLRRAA
jgi:putative transposase